MTAFRTTVIFVIAMFCLSACQSNRTYHILAATGAAVSKAIDQFAEMELKGQVEPELSDKVWKAYGQYTHAYNTAIDVAILTPESPELKEVLSTSRTVLDIVEPLLLKP